MRQRIVVADQPGTSLTGPQPLDRDYRVHVRQVDRACLEGPNLASPNGIGFGLRAQAPIRRRFRRQSKRSLTDVVYFGLALSHSCRARAPARVPPIS